MRQDAEPEVQVDKFTGCRQKTNPRHVLLQQGKKKQGKRRMGIYSRARSRLGPLGGRHGNVDAHG